MVNKINLFIMATGLLLAIIGMYMTSLINAQGKETAVFLILWGIALSIIGAVIPISSSGKGSPVEEELPLPSPPLSKPKSNSQYYCRACGHLFWRTEYLELKVSHCQKCGASDLRRIGSAEHCNPVKPLPIRIKTIKHEEPLPPPPPPSEQVKYRSQFHCNSCGRSFCVYEHRLKIPYCCECGAPNPVFVATTEQ